MKIADIPKDLEKQVEFACRVCRAKFKASTGSRANCACRHNGNICPYVEQIIEESRDEKEKQRPI